MLGKDVPSYEGRDKESATENIPSSKAYVRRIRVKRRGKSSPALRAIGELCKPHLEQDQIGSAPPLYAGVRKAHSNLSLMLLHRNKGGTGEVA